MMDITQDELLEAMRRALEGGAEDDASAKTTVELSEMTGWGAEKVRRVLRRMIREGAAEPTKVSRTNIAGMLVPTTAYRLSGSIEGGT